MGTVGDARQLEFPHGFHELREVLYAALNEGVDLAYDKHETFADDLGMSNRDLSLRLRHGDCSKGYPQLATLDMLAKLAEARGGVGLDAFLAHVAAERGYRLVPVTPATPAEKLKIVAAELSDKRKRELERENGLLAGSLDL